MKPPFKQMLAAASASLVFIGIGFHQAWQPSIQRTGAGGGPPIYFDCLLVGGIFGAILALLMVDTWGRRKTLLLVAISFLIPSILNTFVKIHWWFYITRFITGLGVGVAYVATPMYIGEIADIRIRGGLCVLMPVMMQIGIFVPWALSGRVENFVLEVVGIIIPIVFAVAFFWAPESPHYYAMNDTPEKTKKSLAWLRGTPNVAQEVQQLHNSMAVNRRGPMNFRSVFTAVSSNRKACFIIIGLFLLQRIVFFPVIWLEGVMFSNNPFLAPHRYNVTIAWQTITLLATISIVFLVDVIGRRPLLLVSALLTLICLLVETVYFLLQINGVDVTSISFLTILTLIGYLISISIGLETLPIVMSAEIFSPQAKASALAFSTVIHFVLVTGVNGFLYLVLYLTNDGQGFLYFLVACGILGGILLYFFIPETKGRSLTEENPDFTFSNSNNPRATHVELQNVLHTQV